MLSLPYSARAGQLEFISEIAKAQAEGKHLVAEAGTGSGKTICALTASCHTAAQDGRRILYLTRTNSQQAQVIREHKALLDAGHDAGLLVPFMGRRQYCPLLRNDVRYTDGTAEELGRLCRDAKRKAVQERDLGRPVEGACPFYAKLLADGAGPVESLLAQGGLDGPALAHRIEAAGSCPYEALKKLLPKARVAVLPAVFLVDAKLRAAIQQWLGAGFDECHVVIDEAHHLPAAAREHHSPTLTMTTLLRAHKESNEYGDPLLGGSTHAKVVVEAMQRALHGLMDEYVRDGEDGLVPPDALTEALLTGLRVSSPTLERIAKDLHIFGENVRDDCRSKGRLPRSYLGALANFLQQWSLARDQPYVHLVGGGDNPALELFLLDPSPVLSWLGECWSTLHMSGTLSPLNEYAQLCGLMEPRLVQREFASPFPAEHLRIFGLEGVHRRFESVQQDPTLTARQQEAALAALQQMPGRTGLFFPSHRMLQAYLEEGFLHNIGRPLHVEHTDMSNAELTALVSAFRSNPQPGALLLGVLGGRLTEGLDFPGDAMEHMILFGIPYPRPSARSQALIHYFDARSNNGWQVAVHNSVGRTLRQAIGRLIRGPDDRGTALILDERAVRFHGHLRGLHMVPNVQAMASTPPWNLSANPWRAPSGAR